MKAELKIKSLEIVIFEGFDQCCFLANFLFSLKDENIISTITKIFCERKKGPNLLFKKKNHQFVPICSLNKKGLN
jgi:hypothetical protein